MPGYGERQSPRRQATTGRPSECPHCHGRAIFRERKGWYCLNCGAEDPGNDIGELEWQSRAAREHGGESGIARFGRLEASE